jgi:hypothetical protein
MNNSAAELRGIKDVVIPACPESFFALLYYRIERLPRRDSRKAGMTESGKPINAFGTDNCPGLPDLNFIKGDI